ncbi:hypothetical protein PRIPAC_73978 [Pristionchus pacificus]|uniref:Uncharacterized protein n=1 Tax=Pristionchus pacificus TaxID=54126 RepID=A0A2A6C6Y6_PRIPA|nr:hypothetical protein PRIPAC_73978 [Pristionchus pacificus]|eukprot:PDM73870.1 hypothetical protein PRIPAC_41226 [Pristionchus pacificus]
MYESNSASNSSSVGFFRHQVLLRLGRSINVRVQIALPLAGRSSVKDDGRRVAFWALIKMGYVSEGRSSFKIGSRASGLVFFPYHSRNGWRKNPAPLIPDRTVDGVARRLSPTVGRIRLGRSYPSHGDQSGLDGDSDLVESLVETRGISRNRSPSERMEREPLATTNRHGNVSGLNGMGMGMINTLVDLKK